MRECAFARALSCLFVWGQGSQQTGSMCKSYDIHRGRIVVNDGENTNEFRELMAKQNEKDGDQRGDKIRTM